MTTPSPVRYPTFAEATLVWLKIGLLSFGGPAGQIALMHKELVEERKWVSESRFLNALNYCMVLPGPEAQQLATYIGWLLHGTRGGLVAGTLFVVPGFCVILTLSTFYALYQQNTVLDGVFFGLKAAVLAVVVEALLRLSRRALRNRAMLALAALAFVLIFAFNVAFPLVLIGAALAGLIGGKLWPEWFVSGGHGSAAADDPAALNLEHRRISLGPIRALKVLAVWCALWALPVIGLLLWLGPQSIFVPIAVFFSKMAVVTFGGAYAVLSYVAQEAVNGLGWLRPGEMLDGLALAETTPGPLILVLTFVGFLAAFRDPGALSPLTAAFVGASLTTWVTFVPCFLWIFLGAPYVEALRGNRALSSALTAITAAIVGVVLNLSVWFGMHVLFRQVATLDAGPLHLPWPQIGSLDIGALALSVMAMVLVFRLRLGMVPVLALCGIAGWVWKTLL